MDRDQGFSIIEVALALALTLVVAAVVFALLDPAAGAFSVVPEISDMQQRLRVATDALSTNLMMAGAGLRSGKQAGGLQALFAPVLPYRRGAIPNAPAGSF